MLLTFLHVRHSWRWQAIRIHNGIIVDTTLRMPWQAILFEKVPASWASRWRWSCFLILRAPFGLENKFPMFGVLFNPFFLLLVYPLKV